MNAAGDDRFDRLREKAEALIAEREGDGRPGPRDMLRLVHELRVHQAELEIQNEELRQAQQRVSELHLEYEDLYEFAPCGYLTLDEKGIITHANLTAVGLLGRERGLLLHSSLYNFLSREGCNRFSASRRLTEKEGEKQSLELTLGGEKESPTWVRADITADRDEEGRVHRWRVVLVDITDQKRAELQRKVVETQLRQAQKLEVAGQLAGGVAHDFNNLLQVITGSNDLALEEARPGSAQQEHLERIRLAADRAAALVRQLLSFGRQQLLQMEELDLNEAVGKLVRMLRPILGRGIGVRLLTASEPVRLRADRAQLGQMVMNLCTNARDAMPEGGTITLRTGTTRLEEEFCRRNGWAEPGHYAWLSVADRGIGMDRATLEKIFEPFFTTKEVGQGSGLGLSTVYGILRQHGGLVHAESRPGRGTTMTLYLPRQEELAAPATTGEETEVPGGTETILLVEDDDDLRGLLRSMLEPSGYEVVTARDGEQALALYRKDPHAFDLAILDVVMPRLDGNEAYQRIMEIDPQARVLFMSGYSREELYTNFRFREEATLIPKPCPRPRLLRAIREELDRV